MRILITGSAGHLGEALVRTLRASDRDVRGLDVLASPCTECVGSIVDRHFVARSMQGVDAVIHTATLHKPHVATHSRQEFVDTNITGTLNLLEEASRAGVRAFVFTSTTSVFGRALTPEPGGPAVWVTEDLVPVPKNIYGVTKAAAENLCELLWRTRELPCVVLRTSRFFPEQDDCAVARAAFSDANLKANEFLYRRVELEDVVSAHLLALARAPSLGFARYVISATAPFTRDDLVELSRDAASVVRRYVPNYEAEYARRGWSLHGRLERVYINQRARRELGWQPRYDFRRIVELLKADREPRSAVTAAVGSKGYHHEVFADGPYPVGRTTENH